MEYLFDFNKESASELHEVLGFVDSDFTLIQIKPYLRSATKEIIQIIGETLYDNAAVLYKGNTSAFSSSFSSGFAHSAVEHEFVTLLRYAIALGAFRKFAPLTDVSYTTSGRLFRSDDHSKSAFEWMIDKSDDSMERSYYASVNEILRFIFDEMPEESETVSKRYKLSELFVYNLEVFQEFVSINDFYLLFFRLIPSLKLAQKRLIQPRVGDKFDVYKANEDLPINSTIKQICVYFAMKDGLRKESVQLFPKGVIKETSGSKKHASAQQIDIETVVLYYDDELNLLLKELENAVQKDNFTNNPGRMINFGSEDKFVTL